MSSRSRKEPKAITPKRRITSPPKATKATPTVANTAECIYPKMVDTITNTETIEQYPIRIGDQIHMLHFLDQDDLLKVKHKIVGYHHIDIPNYIKSKVADGAQLISRKSGVMIKEMCGPWTVLYLQKGKHYIYTGQL